MRHSLQQALEGVKSMLLPEELETSGYCYQHFNDLSSDIYYRSAIMKVQSRWCPQGSHLPGRCGGEEEQVPRPWLEGQEMTPGT